MQRNKERGEGIREREGEFASPMNFPVSFYLSRSNREKQSTKVELSWGWRGNVYTQEARKFRYYARSRWTRNSVVVESWRGKNFFDYVTALHIWNDIRSSRCPQRYTWSALQVGRTPPRRDRDKSRSTWGFLHGSYFAPLNIVIIRGRIEVVAKLVFITRHGMGEMKRENNSSTMGRKRCRFCFRYRNLFFTMHAVQRSKGIIARS